MASEAQLRAAALAAFRNAKSVMEDVDLLYSEERWARAVSLAVVGREELGKAIIYTVAALDRLPGLRDVLDATRYDDPVRDHQFKQLAAEIASISHFMAEDVIYNSDGMAGPSTDAEWVDEVLEGCADWLLRSGVVEGGRARRAHVQRERERRQALTAGLPGPVQHDESDELEVKKWRGLYVDLSDGVLHRPESVEEFDARSARVDLRVDLEALFRLEFYLDDDGRWSELDRSPTEGDDDAAAEPV